MAVDLARIRAITAPEWTDEAIRVALGACDADRAAELAFARALAGEDVDARLVAEILPGVRSMGVAIALLGLATGDRAAAWLEIVQQRKFPGLRAAIDVELLALRAAHREGAPVAEVARAARRIARLDLDADVSALIYTFAAQLGDPGLSKLVVDLRDVAEEKLSREFIASVERLEKKPLRQQLESLPEVPDAAPPPAAFTVRTAPAVGRNEPCPCGSGQKYKKCCADKHEQKTGSPIRGLSWDEYLTKGADRMSQEDIDRLTLRDLARVELGKLADIPLITAYRRFVSELAWSRAELALDEWARRHGADDADDHRLELLMQAAHHDAYDVVAANLAKVRDPAEYPTERLELVLRERRPDALAALEARCRDILAREPTTDTVDLAVALMRAVPALGILVARGCLRPGSIENDILGEDADATRDRLGLPPGDPIWDLMALVDADESPKQDDGEAKQLRTNLRVTSARVDELEQQLSRAQDELKQRKAAPTPITAAVPIDRDREKELRAKIDELKSLVSEGNEERGELRRQLAASSKAARAAAPESPQPEVDEDSEVADVVPPRGISIPVVSRRVQDALADAPAQVAAEMLKTLGGLAAGDGFTWRGTKPAQDMPKPVLMARVGIHYRLLFRIEDGMLHTLDFVTRENLDTTLKRLRTTKA